MTKRTISLLFLVTLLAETATAQSGPFYYYPVTPCRIVDTRNPNSPTGGPALVTGQSRGFPITGRCGIPSTAKAVAINATIIGPLGVGHLRLYPYGAELPLVSTLNFEGGEPAIANGAIVPLSTNPTYQLSAYLGGGGSAHFLLDVNGYFQ